MSRNRKPTDTDVVDAIATMLGTNPSWTGDVLDDIANLVGKVRPHPSDKQPDEYAADFERVTGRPVPPEWDQRAELEEDTWSSASRQHYIDTGRYLRVGEARSIDDDGDK